MSRDAGFVWRFTGLCEAGGLGQDAAAVPRSSALARKRSVAVNAKLLQAAKAVSVLLAAGTVREGGV
jgi:hypothetical protein